VTSIWMFRILMLWGLLSPIVYASLAGRASMNLYDTDQWHTYSFRAFCIHGAILVFIFMWMVNREELACIK